MTTYSLLSKKQWEETIKGFEIIDCTFFESNKLLLVVKEDMPDDEYDVLKESSREARGISIIFTTDGVKCGTYGVGGLRFPRVSISLEPELRGLLSSRQNDGLIFAVGKGGIKEMEQITPEGKPGPTTSCNTRKLKCINGWAYAVAIGRRVFKRTAANQWTPILEGLLWPEKMDYLDMGFEDIHGPNENNMYAVGGCGDVWHYNGEKWQWCDFPSNEQLSCVLVAPDGDVYISGEGGNLWRGQMHTWEKIHTGSSSVLNKDLVWYNNQVWVSSDYQLRIWNGKELVRPVHEGKEIIMSGNMDVYENLLLVADLNTVKLFDGTDWHTIVKPY